jgi:hypothetical protein
MSQILKCVCGHQVEVGDVDKGELVWCPKCMNRLSTPTCYAGIGERNLSNNKAAPPSSSSGGRGRWGVGGGVVIFAIIALSRIFSSLHSTRTQPDYHYSPPPSTRMDRFKDWDVGAEKERDDARRIQEILDQINRDKNRMDGRQPGEASPSPPIKQSPPQR